MKNILSIHCKKLIVLGLTVLLIMALLPGCSSSGANRRGNLSDAVEKASDKHEGDRKAGTEPAPDPVPYWEPEESVEEETVPVEPAGNAPDESASLSDSEATLPVEDISPDSNYASWGWATLSFGTALTTQDDFNGLNQFNFTLGGFLARRWRGEVVLGVGWMPMKKDSELRNSLKKNIIILSLGVAGKYYLTPQRTFLGSYLLAGLSYNHMFWEYKNAITADVYDEYGNVTGTEQIHSDDIGGLDIYAGIGFNLAQSSRFQLGLEAAPGILLWGDRTRKGFDNDVFKPAAYAKLKLVINFLN